MNKIKRYLRENYTQEEIQDIAKRGCGQSGVEGLVTLNQTSKFHDKFEKEIWMELYETAVRNTSTVMKEVGDIAYRAGNLLQIKNYLAWWAVELAAQSLIKEDK